MPHHNGRGTPPHPGAARADTVHLERLSKHYGPVRAVDELTLRIPAGQTVALLGTNGAGKSSTIDMLLGLTRPDSGTVTLCGTTARAATRSGLVGAMLQTGTLLRQINVREYVTLAGTCYPNPLPAADCLARAGISHLGRRRTHQLSGGQTQAVRYAAALVSRPHLLVLDEPTVAMDIDARRRFWDSTRELAADGTTVVFATHYLEEADEHADRIVLINAGHVVADGTVGTIKAAVGDRTVRATVPDPDTARLAAIPSVRTVTIRGYAVTLTCTDSDTVARTLLTDWPGACDLEVSGASLQTAFRHHTMPVPDARPTGLLHRHRRRGTG